MEDLDISRFMKNLRRIGGLYNIAVEAEATKHSITRQEADIVLFLTNNPGLDTAHDIVLYRGFSKAYVSKAVDLLMGKGLLTMTVERADRRYQHLCLTERAAPISSALKKMQREFIMKLFEGIPKENLDVFLDTIYRVEKNVIM